MRIVPVLPFLLLCIGRSQTTPPPLSPPAPTPDPNVNRARRLLDEGLRDSNPDTRKNAVEALGLVGPREPYLSQLAVMLDDKDVQVRLATITSLLDLKNAATVLQLRRALESDVPEVSFAAAKALWTLNDPTGKNALLSVLSGEMKTQSGFITKQKRDTLRMLHTPRTMFLFMVRQGAVLAPVPGLGAGVSSLEGILSDAGVSGRAASALLLSADKDPQVLLALEDALMDKDASVRAAAAHSIALRNDPAQERDLIPLLDDKSGAVRLRAAAGYLRLELVKSTAPPQVLKANPPQAPKAKKTASPGKQAPPGK